MEFRTWVEGEAVEASNSLISGRADAKMLTPRASINLMTKGEYLRTFTRLEIRVALSGIDQSDRTLLGGIGVEDRFSRLSLTSWSRLRLENGSGKIFHGICPILWMSIYW